MNYGEIIRKRIVDLCQQRGISTNKLASMCGIWQSTVESILKGRSNNPKLKTLHKIANGLSMTVSEFLDFPELNEYSFADMEEEED
ncbi:MAG: helix-turn-helix transcriptional regulator [Clostridia bacterium]|nr:helix-turn-helix transcriptional regulator [Clostridia bacterium]